MGRAKWGRKRQADCHGLSYGAPLHCLDLPFGVSQRQAAFLWLNAVFAVLFLWCTCSWVKDLWGFPSSTTQAQKIAVPLLWNVFPALHPQLVPKLQASSSSRDRAFKCLILTYNYTCL